MGIEAIDALRSDLPSLFVDRPPPADFEDHWVVIPDTAEAELFEDLTLELSTTLERPPPLVPDLGEPFPGAPQGGGLWLPGAPPPPPDALAFYLPFHYFHPRWWGIYVTVEGVLRIAEDLKLRGGCRVSQSHLRQVASWFLYGHEFFHHKSEVWATRTEIVQRQPLYVGPYEAQFRRHAGSDLWTEEAVANAYAWCFVKRKTKNLGLPRVERECILEALGRHIKESPPGYRMGARMLGDPLRSDGERTLAEEYMGAAGAFPVISSAAWKVFSHAFSGIINEGSRVNFVIRRGSPLLSRLRGAGRLVSARKLKRRLTASGCARVRQGGSHEIWEGPSGRFQIPRHAGDLAAGTVRSILRQAGLVIPLSQLG
jgi:predicted RNA binding protein YcfA (HicA-like mRNA interferase family)